MSGIDWSKAPEDATHAGSKVSKDVSCWYKDIGCGQGQYWYATKGVLHSQGWKPLYNAPSHWPLIARPVGVWTGEGQPPAGVLIEMKYKAATADWARPDFHQVILAWIGKELFVTDEEKVGHICDVLFRPIRTPAQLAVEEREEAIKQFMQIGDIYWDTASALYDAGARLPGRGAKA